MASINGKKISQYILKEQKKIIDEYHLTPSLETILIGNDEASRIYTQEKRKKATKIGVKFSCRTFPTDVSQKEVLETIYTLNLDPLISGILVQFPLPHHVNPHAIIGSIDPAKDVDGFHPINISRFLELPTTEHILKSNLLLPVTPAAIMTIINSLGGIHGLFPGQKPRIVFVGKESVFTTPLVHYFTTHNISEFAGVLPNNPHLAEKTLSADILISACGKPCSITQEMVKAGAVVIDVGISRVNGSVVGDVDFDAVAPKARFITPVAGGVGPVTVAILMRNVVYAGKRGQEPFSQKGS